MASASLNAADDSPASCLPANASNLGYIPNFGSTTVSIVNLQENAVVGTIGGFTEPINAIVSNDGSELFVDDLGDSFQGDIGHATLKIVDLCTDQIVKSIPVPGLGSVSSLSSDGTTLWTDAFIGGPIYRIDTATNQVVNRFDLGLGIQGSFMVAPSPDDSVLYVASAPDFVQAVNAATGASIGHPVPTGFLPGWISITPNGKELITGNLATGDLTIISTTTMSVVKTIKMGLQSTPEYGAVSPDGATYWSSNGDGTVDVVDLASNELVHTIDNGYMTLGVSFNRSGNLAYVTSLAKTPEQVSSLALSPLVATLLLFEPELVNTGPGIVSVYDAQTFQLIDRFPAGETPVEMGIARGPFPSSG